jgi:hypothetical protein
MPNRSKEVETFLRELQHSRKAEIEAIRALILACDPGISERIKWNAPSFCYGGDDRVTFRLQPGDRVQLIFHRGAKVKDSSGFAFTDESGLLEWLAADRAVVTFQSLEDVKRAELELAELVRRWMAVASV